MDDLKLQKNLDSEIFFTVRKNRLLLLLFLSGIMMIFYLCNLHIVYINNTCDTYSLLQIPIIIGACAGGSLVGVTLGGLGATLDFMYASLSTTYIDVISSPFASFENAGYRFSGNISSIFICFLSKLLLALVAGWIFKAFKNRGQMIWQMILVAIAALFSILFSHVVIYFLFNTFFVNCLPNVAYREEFRNFVNSVNWCSCLPELTANIAIDPLIVYAIKMIIKSD